MEPLTETPTIPTTSIPVTTGADTPTATTNIVESPAVVPLESTSPLDKSDPGSPKKVLPKARKRSRKTPKDLTAPRQPLTGYVRFLNDRREKFRAENPNMPFAEITKVLAAEWSALPPDQKQQYLSAAEQDKERYLQEVAAYKQSEAYKLFSEQQVSKKPKEENEETLHEPAENDVSGYDIPIFTEEFLDHNKAREAELRQLRKSNTDYEQQNATIQTYIAGLHNAIEKLSVETQQQRNNNNALEQHLHHLQSVFTAAFSNIQVPGLEVPTISTVDDYIVKLTSFVINEPNSEIVNTIRETVRQLDVQA